MNAVVVGGGSWGTAFALVLARAGHDVVLACRDPEQARAIRKTGRNPRYLRDADLRSIDAAPIAGAPLDAADLLVVAVPSRSFAEVVAALPPDKPLLSLTKGLHPTNAERLSTLTHGRSYAVLSGPNIAVEVADGLPTAAVVASADAAFARRIQQAANSATFRAFVTEDLAGVELCGAVKNVIALAAGIVDGLGLGDNAKAALITRGLAEMSRLGSAFGARPETFVGLAGVGDVIVTSSSPHSRNRRAGEMIARGVAPDETPAALGMVVEGLTVAPVLRRLAHEAVVPLPITGTLCRVLQGEDPRAGVEHLMSLEPSLEHEPVAGPLLAAATI